MANCNDLQPFIKHYQHTRGISTLYEYVHALSYSWTSQRSLVVVLGMIRLIDFLIQSQAFATLFFLENLVDLRFQTMKTAKEIETNMLVYVL